MVPKQALVGKGVLPVVNPAQTDVDELMELVAVHDLCLLNTWKSSNAVHDLCLLNTWKSSKTLRNQLPERTVDTMFALRLISSPPSAPLMEQTGSAPGFGLGSLETWCKAQASIW